MRKFRLLQNNAGRPDAAYFPVGPTIDAHTTRAAAKQALFDGLITAPGTYAVMDTGPDYGRAAVRLFTVEQEPPKPVAPSLKLVWT